MSKKYDTILKEKKTYEETKNSNKHKYLKLFIFLSLIISLLVIVISYVIYYNTVLDNESIFFNNLIKLKKSYYPIYKDISFDYELNNNYLIEGSIDIGNDNYSYSFDKYGPLSKREIFNADKKITYYSNGQNSYMKISTLGDFYIKEKNQFNDLNYYQDNINAIKKDFNNYIYDSILTKSSHDLFNQLYNIDNIDEIFQNIKDNYRNNVTSDKYMRKFYFDKKTPVIEVNLVLDKKDINNILGFNNGLQIKDNYQVNITMKNNAITNDILEIKAAINNKTKNTREVLLYKKKVLHYTNYKKDEYSIKYNINKNNIQIKNNNILYSVIQISSKNRTNIYNYKKIDKIYTISLSVEKVKNNFEYGIETNIDNIAKAIKVSGEYKNAKPIKENIENAVSLDSLSLEQQNTYKKAIAELFN